MTLVNMSLYPPHLTSAPTLMPSATAPPRPSLFSVSSPAMSSSILSATLTARSATVLDSASATKAKLGFSIDSIVGQNTSTESAGERRRSSPSPPPHLPPPLPLTRRRHSSPIAAEEEDLQSPPPPPRDRSPLYRRSPSPIDLHNRGYPPRRSPPPASPPGSLSYSRSDSPPSPGGVAATTPVMRPIPTSLPASGLLNPQSYLDQLASLKAFYEAKQTSSPPTSSSLLPSSPPALLPSSLPSLPNLPLPGLHPMLAGLPRPGLPGFLGGGAGGGGPYPGLPPHLGPRESPLYPWFINRHRFPGGNCICGRISITGLFLYFFISNPNNFRCYIFYLVSNIEQVFWILFELMFYSNEYLLAMIT